MPINVLIIDDSSTTRAIIRRTLKATQIEWGEIFEAVNGAEGLKSMRDNWVDLVLTDLNMPEMNGEQMIDEMLKDDMLKLLPVLVVSAEGSQAVLEALLEKGVKEIVRKPFDATQLADVVRRIQGTAVTAS